MARGERGDELAMRRHRHVRRKEQRAIRLARERFDGALDLGWRVNWSESRTNRKRPGNRLKPTRHDDGRRIVGVVDQRCAGGAGPDLLEHLQHLADDGIFPQREAGEVAARVGEAGDHTALDRITDSHEYNRNSSRLLPQSLNRPSAPSHDNIRVEGQELRDAILHTVHIIGGPLLVELHITTCRPAQYGQLLPQRTNTDLPYLIGFGEWDQDANFALVRRLLRAHRERPRGHSAEQRDELAAFHLHSITSSARASRPGGTSTPSAFAVLRLITSSNFVGCITGKSAGFSPLRMRPT